MLYPRAIVVVVVSVAVLVVVVVVYKNDKIPNILDNIPFNDKCSAQLSSSTSKSEELDEMMGNLLFSCVAAPL